MKTVLIMPWGMMALAGIGMWVVGADIAGALDLLPGKVPDRMIHGLIIAALGGFAAMSALQKLYDLL